MKAGPERRGASSQSRVAACHRRARHHKKNSRVLCARVKAKSTAFMRDHTSRFRLMAMCRVLGVQRPGYYAWRRSPHSARAKGNQRLLSLIKLRVAGQWIDLRPSQDLRHGLRHLVKFWSRHRVRRLMKQDGLRALVGYGKRPRALNGPSGAVAGNVLARAFILPRRTDLGVTDITYIRTYDFLYLAVIADGCILASDRWLGDAFHTAHRSGVAGVTRGGVATQTQSGLAAALRSGLPVHQQDWQNFLKAHGIVCSMKTAWQLSRQRRDGKLFPVTQTRRIKRKIYNTQDEARSDVFDYIEMFYNPKRRHSANGGVSPVEFEKRYLLSG